MGYRSGYTLVTAIVVCLSPTTVRADGPLFRSFADYCTTGAVRACASVTASVVYLGDGTSILNLRIRNLEGTSPFDNTGGSKIHQVLYGIPALAMGRGSFRFPPTGPEGSVGQYGDVITAGPFDPAGGVGFGSGDILSFGQFGKGIVGCTAIPLDPPPYPPLPHITGGEPIKFRGAWQTCPELGYTGSFLISLHMPYELDARDLFVGWSVTTAAGEIIACDTRDLTTCEPVVTPEPITIVLLGSGLAGMGGLRYLRRRKVKATHADSGNA